MGDVPISAVAASGSSDYVEIESAHPVGDLGRDHREVRLSPLPGDRTASWSSGCGASDLCLPAGSELTLVLSKPLRVPIPAETIL
jgi:hypothetical protein